MSLPPCGTRTLAVDASDCQSQIVRQSREKRGERRTASNKLDQRVPWRRIVEGQLCPYLSDFLSLKCSGCHRPCCLKVAQIQRAQRTQARASHRAQASMAAR